MPAFLGSLSGAGVNQKKGILPLTSLVPCMLSVSSASCCENIQMFQDYNFYDPTLSVLNKIIKLAVLE